MKLYKQVGILSLFAVVFLTFAPQANAGKNFVGISYASIDTDVADFTGINFIAGHRFNDYISVEGRTLIHSSTENYYGVDVDIDNIYGVYMTLSLPLSDELSIYAIGGRSRGKASASYMGYSASSSDTDTSIGFGMRFALRESTTLSVEYLELFDDINQLAISAQHNF